MIRTENKLYKTFEKVSQLWSTTQFGAAELSCYAAEFIEKDVRQGLQIMGLVSFGLLGAATTLYALLDFGVAYIYTFFMLTLLALHITVACRAIKTTQMLYMLGITLLVIAGTAFVLLAHKTGNFSSALLSSTVLLFMIVPLVPWGVREATAVVFLIYMVFTLSIISTDSHFSENVLVLLQFLMIGSGITTIIVVARSVAIRKNDLKTRFELEIAHKEMEKLSMLDPLTGAWNRRFLESEFYTITKQFLDNGQDFHLALIDIDNFKLLNDSKGHDYGDKVLQKLAHLVMDLAPRGSHLFRLGGDEFLLLFSGTDPGKTFTRITNLLKSEALNDDSAQDTPLYISTGLVSVNPEQKYTLESVYKEADKALYFAKSQSKTYGFDSTTEVRKLCSH